MQTAESGISTDRALIQKGQRVLLYLYASALFIAAPLAMKDGYSGLGQYKYRVFCITSLLFLSVLLLLYTAQRLAGNRAEQKEALNRNRIQGSLKERCIIIWKKLLITDRFVLLYLFMTIVSFLGAQDKRTAFFGARGWYMGLLSQLLFLGIYFVVSRIWDGTDKIWYLIGAGAFAVFVLGILHRFSIDPLRLYEDMSEGQRLQFLSTLGQATWYSSFVCTVFPSGLYWFFKSDKIKVRILAGVFSAAGFATLVTQNSDSAFLALALVMLLLFYCAFEGGKEMGRFLETALLLLFSFQTVGLLQSVFSSRAVKLDALSEYASQSLIMGMLLIVFCGIYAWYSVKGFSFVGKESGYKLRRVGITAFAAAAAIMIFVVAANTAGIFGERLPKGGYLYFDENWGSGRGRTWMFTLRAFGELPLWRKLIGVGPDSFSSYFYEISKYSQQLYQMWGSDRLTNAHNEWMNAVICYGMAGGAAYLGIFISGIIAFLKRRSEHPGVMAAALCLAAYVGHNLFCYQQVLCTPYVFWMLGMGAALLRKKRIK